MLHKTRRCALLPALMCAVPAFAATTFGEHVRLTGFGTLGAVSTSTDEAQFRVDSRQKRGADSDIDVGVDSKLGLQLDAKVNETFSAVGQLMVSRRLSGTAALEWLYGKASLPAGFEIKLGRMVLPTFMVSDSRSVGYAAHWLRAPQELYGLYPPSSFDGGQLVYRNAFGGFNLTAQVSAGTAQEDILLASTPLDLDLSGIRSLNLLLESGNWLLRLGKTEAKFTLTGLPIPPLTDQFSGIGLQYDNGKLLVMSEYITRREDGLALFDGDCWYVSAGWRFGNWTPYATVTRFTPKGIGYADRKKDTSDALGVRWDAMPNLALKAQVQNLQGTRSFEWATPRFEAERPNVRVVSLAVDFVF